MDPVFEYMKTEQMQKVERFRILNQYAKKGEILFTGSSLMEHFPVNELLMSLGIDKVIYNRGIGGFTTDDMLAHMEEQVFGTEPSKIFINIGTNDFGNAAGTLEEALSKMLANYENILTQIQTRLPETEVYMMAYYPVNETDKVPEGEWGKHLFDHRNNKNLPGINARVEKLAAKFGYHYINVNDGLTDETGKLKKEFTVEGVHMYGNAYKIILENMLQYL